MSNLAEKERLEDWEEKTIGELAHIVMGQSPSSKSYNIEGQGLPFYQGITEFNDKYVSIKNYTTEPNKVAEEGDILFSVRAPVGRVNFTTNKCCIGRGNAALKMKNGNQEFLYYLMRFSENHIQRFTSGTVFEAISGTELKSFPVFVPNSIDEQKAIAAVLSSFDDKIELLRKQNETLEQIAQAIFKEWFVNFNFPDENGKPYKDNGGKMISSELGEIPKGWKVGKLEETVEHIKKNVTPSSNPGVAFYHYSIPAYDLDCSPLLEKGQSIKSNKYAVINKSFLVSKLNPSIPRIWTIFQVENNSVCSTEFQVLKPSAENYFSFLHCFFNTRYFFKELASRASGTSGSHQRVKTSDLMQINIFLPSLEIINKFRNSVYPLLVKINSNSNNIRNLTKLRDTILPKLMNGNIRVKMN